MLQQLIYTSAAKKELSSAELTQILEVSRRNNTRDELTGMLLFEDNTFLQVLEGEEEVVQRTYDRIARDPRHHRILLLARLEVEERSFQDWEMAFFDASGGQLLKLPGYSNFLSGKSLELEEAEHQDKAREVLVSFRHGAWHRC